MGRIHRCCYALLMLLLTTRSASALQLQWTGGATTLSFTEATRCTLVVQADSSEQRLPAEWRLLWVADSCDISPQPLDEPVACIETFAQVSAVDEPSTTADSAAHLRTIHFCSDENDPAASAARYVLDLPAASAGRFQAVALDPNDSTQVIESNEITFNGGASGDYPPAILRATHSHPSTQLVVNAVGVGLANLATVEIEAPDLSWRLGLNVVEQSETGLSAVAQVAADLPPFVLRVGRGSGAVAATSLAADTASTLSLDPACVSYMREYDSHGHTNIQPKDFAVVASRDSFHIFYIRREMDIADGELREKTIGHKRSHNLNDWEPTTGTMMALQTRFGQWDNHHVWAPSIIKKPNDITYWMFYTGVKDTTVGTAHTQVQRIGVATSTDLNVWTPESTWVFSHNNAGWAEQDSTNGSGQQFRDPFVMEDPDSAGHYLMYFVAGSRDRKPRTVVGVARTRGPVADFHDWYNVGPLWNTDLVHTGQAVIESPHAVRDPGGRWWLYYTGYNTGADPAYVSFETNDFSPIDADTTRWSAPDTLFEFLGGDQTLQSWHGSEYLKWAPGYEYLFAYNDNQLAVVVSEMSWHGPHTFALNDSCAPSVPLVVDPEHVPLRLALDLLGAQPSHGSVGFRVQIPARMRVRLAIYDLLGRRLRTVIDEETPAGQRDLRWDGRNSSGQVVGSGVYFARLLATGGQRVARVVLLQ